MRLVLGQIVFQGLLPQFFVTFRFKSVDADDTKFKGVLIEQAGNFNRVAVKDAGTGDLVLRFTETLLVAVVIPSVKRENPRGQDTKGPQNVGTCMGSCWKFRYCAHPLYRKSSAIAETVQHNGWSVHVCARQEVKLVQQNVIVRVGCGAVVPVAPKGSERSESSVHLWACSCCLIVGS